MSANHHPHEGSSGWTCRSRPLGHNRRSWAHADRIRTCHQPFREFGRTSPRGDRGCGLVSQCLSSTPTRTRPSGGPRKTGCPDQDVEARYPSPGYRARRPSVVLPRKNPSLIIQAFWAEWRAASTMAAMALLYGLVAKHSIWYPINLMAAAGVPSLG